MMNTYTNGYIGIKDLEDMHIVNTDHHATTYLLSYTLKCFSDNSGVIK